MTPPPPGSATSNLAPAMLLGVTYNTNNYGVRVLLSGAVAALTSARPNLPLMALDYQHHPAVWHETTTNGSHAVRLINLRFSWKVFLSNNVFTLLALVGLIRLVPVKSWRRRLFSLNRTLRDVLNARACFSLAGGDSFSDIYGVVRLLYVSAPQFLVLWMGLPLVQLPQTFGPFRTRIARVLARYLLSRSVAVYSREEKGADFVRTLFTDRGPPVLVVPDFGFLMEPAPVPPAITATMANWKQKYRVVGVNVSQLLYSGGYTGNNMFGLQEDYARLTREVIDDLLAQENIMVLLVPHVFCEGGEGELPVCRELLQEYRPRFGERIQFFDQTFTHREIKTVIGTCDLFLGARMHACIAAVSQCVPTLALAYSDKFAGVMNVIGGPAVQIIDLRSSGRDEIRSTFHQVYQHRAELRADLERRIPAVRDRIVASAHTIAGGEPFSV